MKKKTLALALVFAVVSILFAGGSKEVKKTASYYTYFDTVCTITIWDQDSSGQFDEICSKAEALISKYNRLFDIYHEYGNVNNLYTLNHACGEYVCLDDELVEFLHFCIDMYNLTLGMTDISLGPVLSLWHKARCDTGVLPSQEALEGAAVHTGIWLIEFDGNNVRLSDSLASLDVGAVAKGWVCEKVFEYLKSTGCGSFIVDIGGNIKVSESKPDGSLFTVGIKNPSLDGTLAAKLNLSDASCVTSGNYERYFTVDGTKYCHIIDPYTLQPASYFASVSVIAGDSGVADALSTALFSMPYEKGLELVSALENVKVIWIFENGEIRHTNDLELY